MRISIGRTVSILCLLVGAGALSPAEGQAPPLRLLVPAYANPCCGGGPAMWTQLTDTAVVMGPDVVVILNPASGPGASPIDPNFVDPLGQGPFIDYRNAGGAAIGYVGTGWATRPIGEVQSEVDRYFDPAYWRGAGVQVDGIFFDEMSNDLADVGYYEALRDHVRGHVPAGLVVGNPGTTFVNNPSGQTTWTIADYAASADTLVTFEADRAAYLSDYTPPPWLADVSAEHFGHIVHDVGDAAAMRAALRLAVQRKAGYLYVTDDVLRNPYDLIPSYWSVEIEVVRALFFADGFGCGDLSGWVP